MSVDLVTDAVHLPIVFNRVETELSVKRCLIGPPDKTCLFSRVINLLDPL